jgi:hypothetical protein
LWDSSRRSGGGGSSCESHRLRFPRFPLGRLALTSRCGHHRHGHRFRTKSQRTRSLGMMPTRRQRTWIATETPPLTHLLSHNASARAWLRHGPTLQRCSPSRPKRTVSTVRSWNRYSLRFVCALTPTVCTMQFGTHIDPPPSTFARCPSQICLIFGCLQPRRVVSIQSGHRLDLDSRDFALILFQ